MAEEEISMRFFKAIELQAAKSLRDGLGAFWLSKESCTKSQAGEVGLEKRIWIDA